MAISGDPARARNAILAASAIAWILILAEPGGTLFSHCAAVGSAELSFAGSFQMLLGMNSPLALAMGWGLMLIAMMAPVMIAPILHVRLRSFRRRRGRATAFVLAAYSGIWAAAGAVLLTIELVAKSFAPKSYWPAAAAAALAIVWQCSPVKQRCLNRCHLYCELRVFGHAADLDTIRFGLKNGFWCVGSCWTAMLVPVLLPGGHTVAMALVSILIFGERLECPAPPSWRWRGLGKLMRTVEARTRIRLSNAGVTRHLSMSMK